ncbi:hypothetical protein A3709_19540 [Halioglobus sp. HI00S01]|uniref:hypothetical protein n=1 Tax=Halioglobus sp. HI00S01 TaxID=1822214 RepID=UPI0007C33588|nr:hypothetical protein [Halioglobus sp. HI00S01]KZX57819.1 hypothetical protein A3709_19540 [Halioglobus sp. HI00S01]
MAFSVKALVGDLDKRDGNLGFFLSALAIPFVAAWVVARIWGFERGFDIPVLLAFERGYWFGAEAAHVAYPASSVQYGGFFVDGEVVGLCVWLASSGLLILSCRDAREKLLVGVEALLKGIVGAAVFVLLATTARFVASSILF